MFRRRKTNEGVEHNKKTPPPPPAPPIEQSSPLGKHNGPSTGMWYKKPQQEHHTQLRRSVGHGADATTTMNNSNPPRPKYGDNRRSIGHAPIDPHHTIFQVPDYSSSNNNNNNKQRGTPVSTTKKQPPPSTKGGTNRRISATAAAAEQHSHPHHSTDTYGDLFELFSSRGGLDWDVAQRKMQQNPSCTRQKQTVLILGQRTTAYPLHLAVCTQAPMPILETLLSSFSSAIQLPDDFMGRLPLHWACIAGANPNVLQKLIGSHPAALKSTDKLFGRTPLHYIAMHASSLTQVNVVLEACSESNNNLISRIMSIKDKQSKTPLDLAQETSNPLKLDILALLEKQNRRNSGTAKRWSAGVAAAKPEEANKQKVYAEWETPLNVKVNKPPPPPQEQHHEYQVPSYGGGGYAPPSPAFPTTRKGTTTTTPAKNGHNHHHHNNNTIPKAPQTGGFFMDRAMLRTSMERGGSSRGPMEDPGPRTNTDSELPRPPDRDRSETWSADSPPNNDDESAMRRSLQDTLMMNAFDFSNHNHDNNDASIPLDPYSQPTLSGGGKSKQRRASATRKLKPPPPNSTQPPQQQQQQQQHDLRSSRGHPAMPPTPGSPKYNQTKQRRSEHSDTGDSNNNSGARPLMSQERDYYRRLQEKMDRHSAQQQQQQPGHTSSSSHRQQQQQQQSELQQHQRATKPGVVHERGPPPRTKKEEEIMQGRNLVNGMNSTIRGLSETIAARERDLQEKESQLQDLDLRIDQMKAAEVDLVNTLDVAKSTARQTQDSAYQKQNRISELARQIQQLQAELRAEEADVQSLERNIPMYMENATRAESKLQAHRDEQGSLGAVRQALDDEKACIVRDLDNTTSELKSLEVIQNLAMRGDDM